MGAGMGNLPRFLAYLDQNLAVSRKMTTGKVPFVEKLYEGTKYWLLLRQTAWMGKKHPIWHNWSENNLPNLVWHSARWASKLLVTYEKMAKIYW